MTTRGKVVSGVLAVVVLGVGAFIGYRLFTKDPGESLFAGVPIIGEPAPPQCAYTGEEARNEPRSLRPAIAVKIENSPEARPQAGLDRADVVYEEEAEGGITRFMAIFQCQDAKRMGPIRSARPVDVPLLEQFDDPLFAYAGASNAVSKMVGTGHLVDLNYVDAAEAYTQDPSRVAPHQFFTSTRALYDAAGKKGGTPEPLFTYDEDLEAKGTGRADDVHLDFSPSADVFWSYDRREDVYLRSHGTTPHTLENGAQVSATNLVVMLVKRLSTGLVDSAGNPVPDYQTVGSGKALVFRGGRVITGRWERESTGEITTFVDRGGAEIALAPGRTWVTLFPTDSGPVEFS